MMKPVVITENGQRKKISKFAAAMTQLANDAGAATRNQSSLPLPCCRPSRPPPRAKRTTTRIGKRPIAGDGMLRAGKAERDGACASGNHNVTVQLGACPGH
jgi:hypothetical protein